MVIRRNFSAGFTICLLFALAQSVFTGSALAKVKAAKPGVQAAAKATTAVQAPPIPMAIPTPVDAPEGLKPNIEQLLKPKSLKKLFEDYDVITNSSWAGDEFEFVNAALIRTPLSYARPKIMDFSLYPKMSPAITKFEYDPKTQIIEIKGEKAGLHMHSWIKVDQTYYDLIRYEVVRGDLTGFRVNAYLWNRDGKTLAFAKGSLPRAKQILPTFVALLFKPVSEVVLSVATKNFRSYIEEEYKKQKTQ